MSSDEITLIVVVEPETEGGGHDFPKESFEPQASRTGFRACARRRSQ
jgi:hypothetical protein